MILNPSLTYNGEPTKLHATDAASLRVEGIIQFVRRPNTIIGEIPFHGFAEAFRTYMSQLAELNGLMCVPYDEHRPELLAVQFRAIPEDAFSHSNN